MTREFYTLTKLSYRARLFSCIDKASKLFPLANALAKMEIDPDSMIYPELMALVAQACEGYLEYYYNDTKENEK